MAPLSVARRIWRERVLALACAAWLGLAPLAAWAAADADAVVRALRLERDGRGRPDAAAAESAALLAATPALSAERLELLTVRGLLFAASSQIEAARDTVRALDAWGATPLAPQAAIAALLVRARVQTEDGNMQVADALLGQASQRATPDLPPRTRLRLASARALVKKESGQLEQAMRLYQDALALADELALPEWRVDMRCGLARVYLLAGQLERARRLNREALDIATASADEFSIYRVWGTEGVLLDAAGDRAGVREAFEAALVHARRARAASAESLTLSNLSDVFLKNGQYKTALTMAEQALPLTVKLGDKDGQTVALFNAGVAHIALHEIDVGKRLVAESIAIDERRGSLSSMAVSYKELGEYLERAGDAAGAVQAYHRHRALADDIVRRDQQKVLVELQERFDAERRAKDLVVLNRENDLKTEQLRRQALQQDLWWLLAACFSVSLAAMLWLHRRVRRTNRLLEASNLALAAQGERDPLTGLANRRHFHASVAKAHGAEPFEGTLFLVDLDHFKRVNDSRGHAAGDAVLFEVAQRLRGVLREQDLLVRWGGEEFLVATRDAGAARGETLAARLLHALGSVPVSLPGGALTVTASIGHASFPIGPDAAPVTVERAIRLVDAALYHAKAHGRNQACGVRRAIAPDVASLDEIAADLQAAARDGRAELTVMGGPAVWRAAA